MKKRLFTMTVLVLLSAVVQGCDKEPKNRGPHVGTKPLNGGVHVYQLAVHPLHNPAKLMQAYQPPRGFAKRHET